MSSRMKMAFTLLFGAALFGSVRPLQALINPQFTPVHLTRQADIILQLRPLADAPQGKMVFAVEKVWKGTLDAQRVEVDLTGAALPDQARFADKLARESVDKLALMFIAAFADKPGDEPGGSRKAYIHLDGSWLVLNENEGAWKFDQASQVLVQTWNGGSDMLLRAVQYVLDDPDAEVPSKTGVNWGSVINLGKVDGKVYATEPVDLKGTGAVVLFVAAETGDRLFSCADEKPAELTAAAQLTSRSQAHAWGDFNQDGRLDLASWDGKKIAVYLQGTNGVFRAAEGGVEVADCLALTALDVGTSGSAGLLVSTTGAPMVWMPNSKEPLRLVCKGEWPGKDLGVAGACLIADFDGDGLPDIVQPLTNGGLFYKGLADGGFAAPVPCEVANGGAMNLCLGDWDGDGRLDIFAPAQGKFKLWENKGGGHFADKMRLTGESQYMASGSAVGACACDLNSDGRQDLTIFYADAVPQIFFDRGFRSFGLSLSLDLGRGALLPEASKGAQAAGCVADFTGDHAPDMALALNNGDVVVVARVSTGEDLCARVILHPATGTGPVRVWGLDGKRGLGAWNVSAGSAPACIARTSAGSLKVKWLRPGQPEQTTDVVLEDKPVNVIIGGATKAAPSK